MTVSRRTLALPTVAASAVLGVVLAAAPAQAVSWDTIGTMDHARIQACKVSVDDGQAWKIRLRVVNHNHAWVKSRVVVMRGDEETDRRWNSGRVSRDDTATGAVRMGQSGDWSLQFSLSAAQAGGGGLVDAEGINGC